MTESKRNIQEEVLDVCQGGNLTHPEAQGNKDLDEPAASGLEVPDFARLAKEAKWIADRMIWEREGLNKFTTGSGPPLFIPFFTWYAEVASALLQASAKHEAAPTSPQPINGESRFTAACKAADAILAPMTAEFGRILEEAPTQPVTVSICSYSVEIPAKKFMDLYDATDRTESELESASNGMGLR